jgi:hypothetical protein
MRARLKRTPAKESLAFSIKCLFPTYLPRINTNYLLSLCKQFPFAVFKREMIGVENREKMEISSSSFGKIHQTEFAKKLALKSWR